MQDSALDALRDREVAVVRERHFERLAAFFRREIRGEPFLLCGIPFAFTDSPRPDACLWESRLEEGLRTLASQAGLARHRRVHRPLILCWDPHGVHFVDELFGARVFMLDGGWQAETLGRPVGTLEPIDVDASATWVQLKSFTRCFLERAPDAVTLALPTIASPLNVAVNLYGQEIILAMLLDPGAARHDLRVITDTLCALHGWYLDHVPQERMQCIAAAGRTQPHGFGQVCGCTTHVLSPELYAGFVAPLDEEVLSLYPNGGMIHLCGAHVQHVPVWRGMAALRAVQMNDRAVVDVGTYYRELRDDQILYANPFPGMPVDGILGLTEGGNRTVIAASPESVEHVL